jgi:hypothetical protein
MQKKKLKKKRKLNVINGTSMTTIQFLKVTMISAILAAKKRLKL